MTWVNVWVKNITCSCKHDLINHRISITVRLWNPFTGFITLYYALYYTVKLHSLPLFGRVSATPADNMSDCYSCSHTWCLYQFLVPKKVMISVESCLQLYHILGRSKGLMESTCGCRRGTHGKWEKLIAAYYYYYCHCILCSGSVFPTRTFSVCTTPIKLVFLLPQD